MLDMASSSGPLLGQGQKPRWEVLVLGLGLGLLLSLGLVLVLGFGSGLD